METIINIAVRFSGLGWLWEVTDGWKTYIAATISILTGLTGVLQELAPVLATHNAGALFTFLKSLPHDQAWIMLTGGLGLLGLGHKAEKAKQV